MKNLHFALCGMVIMVAAALWLLAFCSFGETGLTEHPVIEEEAEDDAEADGKTPVINKEEPSGGAASGGKPSEPSFPDDEETAEDEPATGEPHKPSLTEEEDRPQEPSLPGEEETPDDDEMEYSSGMPAILINEIRTEYNGSGNSPWAEFIEFKILSAGNLGGLKVFIASNVKNTLVFEFLPVYVKKNEYVVLHLRTLDDKWVNEYGSDLKESGGNDSSPNARDFWVPGNTELLRKTDAVYIMDMEDKILDAVMFAENTIPTNSVSFFFEAAEFLFSNGAWKSINGSIPGHEDAVKSAPLGSARTRSLSRDETTPDTNTAADWFVTENGGLTAGGKNEPRR